MDMTTGDGPPDFLTDTPPSPPSRLVLRLAQETSTPNFKSKTWEFVTTPSPVVSPTGGRIWQGLEPVQVLSDGSTKWIDVRPTWRGERLMEIPHEVRDEIGLTDEELKVCLDTRNPLEVQAASLDHFETQLERPRSRTRSRSPHSSPSSPNSVETQPTLDATPATSGPTDHGTHMQHTKIFAWFRMI